jgi:hypothetical protein
VLFPGNEHVFDFTVGALYHRRSRTTASEAVVKLYKKPSRRKPSMKPSEPREQVIVLGVLLIRSSLPGHVIEANYHRRFFEDNTHFWLLSPSDSSSLPSPTLTQALRKALKPLRRHVRWVFEGALNGALSRDLSRLLSQDIVV